MHPVVLGNEFNDRSFLAGGTVCPESRSHGPGKVTEHTGNIVKRKKKEKIKQRLGGVNIGSGKK